MVEIKRIERLEGDKLSYALLEEFRPLARQAVVGQPLQLPTGGAFGELMTRLDEASREGLEAQRDVHRASLGVAGRLILD